MKKLSVYYCYFMLVFLLSNSYITQAQHFQAEGVISKIQEGNIYLLNRFSPEQDTLAKAHLKDGKFYLKGDYPKTALFDVNIVIFLVSGVDGSSFSGPFFIEKNTKVKMSNTKETDFYFAGSENIYIINEFFQSVKSKGELIEKLNTSFSEHVDSINTLKSQIGKEVYEFVKANENSQILEAGLVTLFSLIDANMFNGDNMAYFQSVINKIVEKSFIAQMGMQLIESKNTIKEGQQAPDFVIDSFTLSSQKGKPILLVFWASWCGPCVANIDKLKEIYSKFNAKDLEIIGISSDTNKEQHQKSLDKYSLPWFNFMDDIDPLKSVYRQYLANTIPYYILINQKGEIEKISSKLDLIEDSMQKIIK